MTEKELMAALAEQTHAMWARWTTYLLDKGERAPDGSVTLPAAYVQALRLQTHAAYRHLSPHEQQLDLEEVRRFMPIIFDYTAACTQGALRLDAVARRTAIEGLDMLDDPQA